MENIFFILDRQDVIIDKTKVPRYVKLQEQNKLFVACTEAEAIGVIAPTADTIYPLANVSIDSNAVKVVETICDLPADFAFGLYKYNYETDSIEPIAKTNIQKREMAYKTEKLISWDNDMITVDHANGLFTAYTAEGNLALAQELTVLIVEAKNLIREKYPEEN